jgi:hypothetical protein
VIRICELITVATAIPDASSLARLILKPEESRSTLRASFVCAPARFLWAIKEAILVLRTDDGTAMAISKE